MMFFDGEVPEHLLGEHPGKMTQPGRVEKVQSRQPKIFFQGHCGSRLENRSTSCTVAVFQNHRVTVLGFGGIDILHAVQRHGIGNRETVFFQKQVLPIFIIVILMIPGSG